jgi:outer membrane receptor for ferrienterochelin and colicin
VRFELFNETESDEESEKVNNLGYNLKGGFSYSFDRHNTFFINTGFYQRQPFHDNIYLNFSNFVNPVTEPEKIFGLEAGYKYQKKDFAFNLNVYRTTWKDRTTTRTIREGDTLPNGVTLTAEGFRNTVQDQLHTGVELDFSYDVNAVLRLKGFASIGDWAFDGFIDSEYYDEDRNLLYAEQGTEIDGVKVGGAAQTTFGIGADFRVTDDFKFDVDYFYYDKLHSNIGAGNTSLELPSFSLVDLGAVYNVTLNNGQVLTFRGSVYNLTGTEYISRATSAFEASTNENENWKGINRSNFVTFGKTTTWNFSMRYSF